MRRSGWREAVEITEQISVTAAEWTDEGLSQATAVDKDARDVVEAAGHFRIYLGAAAGVGKTYAMLNEGLRRRGRGADVVVGFVECHGRRLTEALIDGPEVIPRKTVEYRGTRLDEMDLDAVLQRRPKIALIDELAHTNVPGSGGTRSAGRMSWRSSMRASTSSPPSTSSTSRASPMRSSR